MIDGDATVEGIGKYRITECLGGKGHDLQEKPIVM